MLRLRRIEVMQEEIASTKHAWVEETQHFERVTVKSNIQHYHRKPFFFETRGSVRKVSLSEDHILVACNELSDSFQRGVFESVIGCNVKIPAWKPLEGVK